MNYHDLKIISMLNCDYMGFKHKVYVFSVYLLNVVFLSFIIIATS